MKKRSIDRLDGRDPALMARLLDRVWDPISSYFSADLRGIERVPQGPGLYVGNHNAGMVTPDSFLFGGYLIRSLGPDAVPYWLGHEWAIQLPVINQIVVPMGAVRASHEMAHRVFEAGHKAFVYPGGDVDAMRPWRLRNRVRFGGRSGFARLAIREGVPFIPVVTHGAHSTFFIIDDLQWLARAIGANRLFRVKVWPLTFSIPWGFTLGPPPPYFPLPTQITIEILDPIMPDRTGEEAAADDAYVRETALRIQATLQSALDRLADEKGR